MSDEKCEHVLDYEETHCTKCMKPTWQIAHENGLDRIEALEKRFEKEPVRGLILDADKQVIWVENFINQIAELKELFDKHDCFKSWQKNIKVFDYDSPTSPDPYYACGKEKTEKKEVKGCFNCLHLKDSNCDDRDMNSYKTFYYTTFWTAICDNYIKDSGGDKSGAKERNGEHTVPEIRGHPEVNVEIQPDSKLPENPCSECEHEFPSISERCKSCCRTKNFDKFEPKTEPEKEPVVEPTLDLWQKNTITVVCPYCHVGYYLAPKSIEERVRGATRKELIEEFLTRIDWIMERIVWYTDNPDSELMDEIAKEYEEWQGKLKK